MAYEVSDQRYSFCFQQCNKCCNKNRKKNTFDEYIIWVPIKFLRSMLPVVNRPTCSLKVCKCCGRIKSETKYSYHIIKWLLLQVCTCMKYKSCLGTQKCEGWYIYIYVYLYSEINHLQVSLETFITHMFYLKRAVMS